MPRPKGAPETRRLILEAAMATFGSKGHRKSTIAEICRLAGTNLASVNYHFGDKDSLYVESWREAHRRSIERYPIDGGISADAPPTERLRGWILGLLNRASDPACCDFEIVHMEISNPTGLLSDVIRKSIEPIEAVLISILRELLGAATDATTLELCAMSIRAQCMNPMVVGRRRKLPLHGKLPRLFSLRADPDQIAEHVIRFTLAGLEGVRAAQPSTPVAAPSRPAPRRRRAASPSR